MKRFVEGEDRRQATLLPDCLDGYVTEDNPVRIVDVFVDELDLAALGFAGIVPEVTGRPAYHPATLLKISIYGYLNRIQSSRRLERETQRNIELMWLTGRLMPDFKTIADFRRDNGPAIRAACAQFVVLCRKLKCSCSLRRARRLAIDSLRRTPLLPSVQVTVDGICALQHMRSRRITASRRSPCPLLVLFPREGRSRCLRCCCPTRLCDELSTTSRRSLYAFSPHAASPRAMMDLPLANLTLSATC
jgi:transposase